MGISAMMEEMQKVSGVDTREGRAELEAWRTRGKLMGSRGAFSRRLHFIIVYVTVQYPSLSPYHSRTAPVMTGRDSILNVDVGHLTLGSKYNHRGWYNFTCMYR